MEGSHVCISQICRGSYLGRLGGGGGGGGGGSFPLHVPPLDEIEAHVLHSTDHIGSVIVIGGGRKFMHRGPSSSLVPRPHPPRGLGAGNETRDNPSSSFIT